MSKRMLLGVMGCIGIGVADVAACLLLRHLGLTTDVSMLVVGIASLVVVLLSGSILFYLLAAKQLLEKPAATGSARADEPVKKSEVQNTAPIVVTPAVKRLPTCEIELQPFIEPRENFVKPASRPRPVPVRSASEIAAAQQRQLVRRTETPVTESERPINQPVESLSREEILARISAQEKQIVGVLNDARNRVRTIERLMENRIHLIGSDIIKSHLNAKRIIAALEARLDRVHALCRASENRDLIRAYRLLNADLHVQADAVNTLISAEELPPLPLQNLALAVDELLRRAETALQQIEQRTRRASF